MEPRPRHQCVLPNLERLDQEQFVLDTVALTDIFEWREPFDYIWAVGICILDLALDEGRLLRILYVGSDWQFVREH